MACTDFELQAKNMLIKFLMFYIVYKVIVLLRYLCNQVSVMEFGPKCNISSTQVLEGILKNPN